MAFAFSNIILNQVPLTYNAGRLYINGLGVAYTSESAGSVTGLTVESGDSRYVRTVGNQSITGGLKIASGILGDAGEMQIDPVNSYLYSNGAVSQDWENRALYGRWQYTGHTVAINDVLVPSDLVCYRILTDYAYPTQTNPSGYFSPSGAGVLYSTDGSASVGLSDRVLFSSYYATSGHSIDFGYFQLINGKTGSERKMAASWEVGELYDAAESQSVEWMTRKLDGSGGFADIRVDWADNILSGNWKTNTVPTLSGHILNKGYFDSVSGSLGGGAIPSDVVRTTGAQSISGAKRFVQSVEISNATGLERMFIAEGGAGYFNVDSDGFVKIHSNSYGSEATFYSESMSFTDGTSDTMLVSDRMLMGEWISDFSPTQTGGLATKGYVDSTSSYTIPFIHSVSNVIASTDYYFASAPVAISTSQSTSPVTIIPKSGVLQSLIGVFSIAGTLASTGVVSIFVHKNGTPVATGTYLATGRNNVISSGVQNLNIPVAALDQIQLKITTPAWSTAPTSTSHSLNAYVTLA